jgi:transcriptional regulator with XRE-family HTH domain
MMALMMLDDVIRSARHEAGLTQAELALRAETSQPAVARYEQGSAVPTLRTLERLLAACGRQVVISAVAVDDTGSPGDGGPPSDGSVPDVRSL